MNNRFYSSRSLRLTHVSRRPSLPLAVLLSLLPAAAGAAGSFIYGTPSGCLVVFGQSLPDHTHPKWDGSCAGGYANGDGVLSVLDRSGHVVDSRRVSMRNGIPPRGPDFRLPPPGSAPATATPTAPPAPPLTDRVAANEGTCRVNLQYLSARLPVFADRSIAEIRNQIIQTDIRTTIDQAKAQGFNASSAVDASLKQAREHDLVARQGAECAADVSAWGGSDEEFYQAIASGRIDRSIACQSSIRNSCLCEGLINKMAAAGSRAVAAAMQCLAKNGQW